MDAVVACVDAGTSRDFIGATEAKAAGEAVAVAADASYVPDPVVRAEIDAVITSVLSRLVGPEMVRETVRTLEHMASELTKPTPFTGEPPKDLFCAANYAPASLIRAVMRLGLLAGTAAGLQVRGRPPGETPFLLTISSLPSLAGRQ